MLYSEKELEKCLKAGCALYYFYASDEALVHTAAQKTLKYLNRDDPETTVLDGPTPSVEEIVLAAGTISFFGGKRLVLMPLIRPSTYSDKDLQELCDTLADTENAIFVLTSIIEESYGKLRPGKREQKLIASCEKLGYCVQLNRPTGAALQAMARDWAKEAGADFAPGAEAALLARCGDQVLMEHPTALLVLMRCMFNWHQIPKMLELKNLLLETVDEHPTWPGEYRSNLLGECDLITSLLFYNDIAAMSVLHRSASEKMTRPAISIQKANGWTFNSPSVLMMSHSKPGAPDAELAELDRCMPHYCKITDDHGIGADLLMQAEAAFTRGQLDDAMIALERTYAQTDGSGQENIALCGDFLSLRLSLFGQGAPRYTPLGRYELLQQQHNAPWVRFWDACCAYYYALLGQEEAIPEPFRLHRLERINFLAPGRPMILLIENQVYLTQKAWPKVIGRSEKLLEGAAAFRYSLVALYLRIQTAAAYAMMAKQTEAAALLQETLQEAKMDGLVLPFAENYRYLKPLLQDMPQDAFTSRIQTLGEALETHCAELLHARTYPAGFDVLTEREREICALIAARLSNREIAAKLFLSEGSVKQYCNRIYSKLNIEGDTRSKRRRLAAWMANC